MVEAELAALSGLLDPTHPGTADVVARVAFLIDKQPTHRILHPDRDTWSEAGILAGLLARLQHFGKHEQRKALDDAVIFLTATKRGCTVLTRNVSDFDFLLQLLASGHVAFYDRTDESKPRQSPRP